VEGVVNARLALSDGQVRRAHADHIVLVGLGSVGTRVLRQLNDLGLDVVAIDRDAKARGVKVTQQLGVPLIVGDAALAMKICEAALEQGVFAQAIRPPTVPEGASRLRLAVMASHTRAELREAARVLARAALRNGMRPGTTVPVVAARPEAGAARPAVFDGDADARLPRAA
jgi:voltage-gated potassium channel Kch